MPDRINYFAKARSLKVIAEMDDPPRGVILELCKILRRPEFASAFFEALTAPEWIDHLGSRGFFEDPDLDPRVAVFLEPRWSSMSGAWQT